MLVSDDFLSGGIVEIFDGGDGAAVDDVAYGPEALGFDTNIGAFNCEQANLVHWPTSKKVLDVPIAFFLVGTCQDVAVDPASAFYLLVRIALQIRCQQIHYAILYKHLRNLWLIFLRLHARTVANELQRIIYKPRPIEPNLHLIMYVKH